MSAAGDELQYSIYLAGGLGKQSPESIQTLAVLKKLKTDFPTTMESSVLSNDLASKGKMYEWLLGKRYREAYKTLIKAPDVKLDTLLGGGHQSKSLRLSDEDGKLYVIRALKKDHVLFL